MRAEFFQVCVRQHLHSFPSDACCTSGTVLSRNLGRWEQNTYSAGICVLSASLMKISNKKILAATGVRKNCCPSGRVQAMQSQNIIPRKSQKKKKEYHSSHVHFLCGSPFVLGKIPSGQTTVSPWRCVLCRALQLGTCQYTKVV